MAIGIPLARLSEAIEIKENEIEENIRQLHRAYFALRLVQFRQVNTSENNDN